MSDATDVRRALAEIAREPPARWRTLLAARFPDDPALAAQAHLWLHAEAAGHADDAEAWPRLASEDRYLLETCLGRGGTASVWRADDRKLGREVAIKVFHGGETSASLGEALHEARAACDVASDHVVRVLDVHDDGGAPAIVMELVGEHDVGSDRLRPGESAARCRPRSIDEAVRWVRDAARGVHDAHLRNVFHRDLKPHNVLITPVTRRARVADFGLAVSGAGDAAALALVRGGPSGAVRIAGTPAYMAPEQARGLPVALDPHDADDRARLVALDVWGLGALAYDLLSGAPPWRGRDDADAWELAASGQPPPHLDRTRDGDRIPRRLGRIVERALAADPGARHATAAAVADELDAFLSRRPLSFDRTRAVRLWLWSRRNPQLTITVLVAVGLAIGTLTAYLGVVSLRRERQALTAEMDAQEVENDDLARRVAKSRKAFATADRELHAQTEALLSLQRALVEEQREYQGIIEAKEKALRDADQATRSLVDELAEAKSARDAAQFGRALYESYWSTARADADRAGKERDAAVDATAAAGAERDAAVAARTTAQQARDQARADRDHAVADRDQALAEVARLTAAADASAARLHDLERRLADAAAPVPTVTASDAGAGTAPRLDAGEDDAGITTPRHGATDAMPTRMSSN